MRFDTSTSPSLAGSVRPSSTGAPGKAYKLGSTSKQNSVSVPFKMNFVHSLKRAEHARRSGTDLA